MFFDVGFERDESLIDKVGGFFVAVCLGFQPSTCASRGSGRKID
jgi:hypothetical protein